MSTWPWEREAELAVRAVTTAAPLLADRPDPASVATKGSARDVVTAADRAIEQHVRALVDPLGHAFLGEETAPDATMSERPTWVVDPIDGTANWLAGLDWYGVSVALRVGADWPVGAVLLPARNELFFAWRDGAYFNGRTMRPPGDPPIEASLIAAGFSGKNTDPERRTAELGVFGALNDTSRGALRLGSAAANVCAVARGALQVTYGIDAGLWDVAGGVAVARALGLTVILRARPGNRCDYVVGSPRAAAAVAEVLASAGVLVEG